MHPEIRSLTAFYEKRTSVIEPQYLETQIYDYVKEGWKEIEIVAISQKYLKVVSFRENRSINFMKKYRITNK